ncbi:MAG: hypothetical protein GY787_32420 [Alteromonadales bacterium]|nr:hypothetical protein [Alteromonadales bacterium]
MNEQQFTHFLQQLKLPPPKPETTSYHNLEAFEILTEEVLTVKATLRE